LPTLKRTDRGAAEPAQKRRAGRFDQGGAALLVRLYLNAEKWTGTARYTDAARVAQEIINGQYGTYSLDPDYRGPFRSAWTGTVAGEHLRVSRTRRTTWR
jgi:hypothetical protein